MNRLYAHATPAGNFYICRITSSYFVMFENRLLDSYPTPERAAFMLAANRRLSLPPGISFDELDIPADLHQWEQID